MLFLRRKPKEGRAALDDFLSNWEKFQAFDPRERRDPNSRLVDFLNTIPQSVENGRRQLVEAGRVLDLPVYYHVVVGANRYVSFAEAGLL